MSTTTPPLPPAPPSSSQTPSHTLGTPTPNTTYSNRSAVRLIVVNPLRSANTPYPNSNTSAYPTTKTNSSPKTNLIALLHASKERYYKLPGGGIEGDESHLAAGLREAKEEIGCVVDMDRECMGVVELVEDLGVTALEADVVEDGLAHEWVSVEAAMEKIKDCKPTSELGEYIRMRDIYFLEMYLQSE